MNNSNIIKFGYGDILVYHNINQLLLYKIDKPQKIGYQYDKDNYTITASYSIPFHSISEIDKFISELKDILLDQKFYQVECNGVIFDFTNWNEISIQICIDAVEQLRYWFLVPMAC